MDNQIKRVKDASIVLRTALRTFRVEISNLTKLADEMQVNVDLIQPLSLPDTKEDPDVGSANGQEDEDPIPEGIKPDTKDEDNKFRPRGLKWPSDKKDD